jgi:hypothetical protein
VRVFASVLQPPVPVNSILPSKNRLFFWGVLLDGGVVNIRTGSLIFQGTVVMKSKNRRDNHQGFGAHFYSIS